VSFFRPQIWVRTWSIAQQNSAWEHWTVTTEDAPKQADSEAGGIQTDVSAPETFDQDTVDINRPRESEADRQLPDNGVATWIDQMPPLLQKSPRQI